MRRNNGLSVSLPCTQPRGTVQYREHITTDEHTVNPNLTVICSLTQLCVWQYVPPVISFYLSIQAAEAAVYKAPWKVFKGGASCYFSVSPKIDSSNAKRLKKRMGSAQFHHKINVWHARASAFNISDHVNQSFAAWYIVSLCYFLWKTKRKCPCIDISEYLCVTQLELEKMCFSLITHFSFE